MKKAIVTGANGFIGRAVVSELINQNVQVWALTRHGDENNFLQSDKIKGIQFDLSNITLIKKSIPFDDYDVFYHLAWDGTSGSARNDIDLQLKNAQWTVDALRVAKELGCKRFVGVGSIMEDETIAAAFSQGNKPGMSYIYGGGKLIAHVMCKSVAAEIDFDLIWCKITNAYGKGETSPRLINSTIRKIIAGETPRFTSGTQNYDFIYIDDVARAFHLIGELGKPFHEYLIGSSKSGPLREFLLQMKAAIAPNVDFIFGDVPFSGINLDISKFDCSKTEIDTGFKAEVSFSEGVKLTKDWIESNNGGSTI